MVLAVVNRNVFLLYDVTTDLVFIDLSFNLVVTESEASKGTLLHFAMRKLLLYMKTAFC